MTVLDVGTGSGILSIAAAKMGAPYVLAVDIDPVAIRVAWENVRENDVAEQVSVRLGTIEMSSEGLCVRRPQVVENGEHARHAIAEGFFALVLANIIAEVLIELARPLSASLQSEGHLVASGIIQDRTPSVEAALSSVGIQIVDRLQDGDWVTLIGIKGEGLL